MYKKYALAAAIEVVAPSNTACAVDLLIPKRNLFEANWRPSAATKPYAAIPINGRGIPENCKTTIPFITQIPIALTYNSVVTAHLTLKNNTENNCVITVEYVGAGATADGTKGVAAGELKVSEVGGFEESESGSPGDQLVSPVGGRHGGFRLGRGAFERRQPEVIGRTVVGNRSAANESARRWG